MGDKRKDSNLGNLIITGIKKIISGDYQEWLMYTVAMGVLPLVLKIFVLVLVAQPIPFKLFRVELFFLTVVFLVDALKKYNKKSGNGKLALLILIISVAIYVLVLTDEMELLKVPLSSETVKWSAWGFLLTGFIVDFLSIRI